jgi:hypothetical protein
MRKYVVARSVRSAALGGALMALGAGRARVCGRPRARRSRSRWNKNLSDGLKW